MNFLKIALSNGLKNNSFNSWQTTNLNDNPQASELAAIVVADTDQDSIKTAQDLQKTSGLGIPIIKVSHEIISNNEKNQIRSEEKLISKDTSKVKVYVIPTNEELMIAKETQRLI